MTLRYEGDEPDNFDTMKRDGDHAHIDVGSLEVASTCSRLVYVTLLLPTNFPVASRQPPSLGLHFRRVQIHATSVHYSSFPLLRQSKDSIALELPTRFRDHFRRVDFGGKRSTTILLLRILDTHTISLHTYLVFLESSHSCTCQ